MKSLQYRIFVPSILIVGVSVIVILAITYFSYSQKFKERAIERLSDIGIYKTELIDRWVEDARIFIEVSSSRLIYRSFLLKPTPENQKQANEGLLYQKQKHPLFSYIHIINPQGVVKASSMPESIDTVKLGDREYFQKAFKGEINVSTVYLARTTGKPAFAIAAPVYDGDKIIGVISGVPDLSKFSEQFIQPVKVFSSGYMCIFDSTGIVFAHKDESKILKWDIKKESYGQKLIDNKQGIFEYEDKGIKFLSSLASCKDVDWKIMMLVPKQEIMEGFQEVQNSILLISILCVCAIAILGYFIAKSLILPVTKISNIAGIMSQGDLKQSQMMVQEIPCNRSDEIGILIESMQSMVKMLSQNFQDVSMVSKHLLEASKNMTEMVSQQEYSISTISTSINQITVSAEEMESSAKEVENNAIFMFNLASNCKKISLEAQNTVVKSIESMECNQNQIAEIAKKILALRTQSQQIGNITNTIQDIAAQTNMLALNAAIEAARAGENGKGFSVVASHIRDLAQKSSQASREISGLIKSIQDSADVAVKNTEAGKKGIETGVILVQKFSEDFTNFLSSMEQMEQKSQDIRLGTGEQTSAMRQISQGMFSINEVMSQIVSLSKRSQEMVSHLKTQSQTLLQSIEKFKLE